MILRIPSRGKKQADVFVHYHDSSHSTEGNRFGDDDLDTPFVWKKKNAQGATSVSEKQLVLKRVLFN